MSATDIIAAVALAAAILSLVLQFIESGRRGEEIGFLRKEGRRRDEEIALLRKQVEGEEEDRLRHEQAQLAVFAGVQGSGSEHAIEYTVGVQNTGVSPASQIAVELVDGQGATVGTSELIPSLVPNEKAYAKVTTPPRDRYSGPYEIYFEWKDGRPERNRAASGVQVGLPAP